jgi:polysaccharide pyruvyl transferase WcaK-like protein
VQKKILILGGDSDFNLGDAAILAGLCSQFGRAGASEITITSSRASPLLPPGATTAIRRGMRGAYALGKAARAADLIIIGGGGLFQDDDSRIKMPYWASRVTALQRLNTKIVGHSLGVGPLNHAESRWFARQACAKMQSFSVRDGFAKQWLERCVDTAVPIVPDPAFMLAPAPPEAAETALRAAGVPTDRAVIGVTLRRWFHPRGGFIPNKVRAHLGLGRTNRTGSVAMGAFLDRLAAALQQIAAQFDASILLLPTYTASHEDDSSICRDLASRLTAIPVNIAVINDPALYKAVAGKLVLMISGRMHPLILAAGMGVPIVGIAYNGKFAGVMDLLGVPNSMLWIDDFLKDGQDRALVELTMAAVAQRTNLQARVQALVAEAEAATSRLVTN